MTDCTFTLLFDGFVKAGDAVRIRIDKIPGVEHSGALFMARESESLLLVQGSEHAGLELISDGEGTVVEMTSTLPSGEASLEITLKDVVNM